MFECVLKFQKCSLGGKKVTFKDINQSRIRNLQKTAMTTIGMNGISVCSFMSSIHFPFLGQQYFSFIGEDNIFLSSQTASFPTITGSSKPYGPKSTDADIESWICCRTLLFLWAPLRASSLLCHLVSGLKYCHQVWNMFPAEPEEVHQAMHFLFHDRRSTMQ